MHVIEEYDQIRRSVCLNLVTLFLYLFYLHVIFTRKGAVFVQYLIASKNHLCSVIYLHVYIDFTLSIYLLEVGS